MKNRFTQKSPKPIFSKSQKKNMSRLKREAVKEKIRNRHFIEVSKLARGYSFLIFKRSKKLVAKLEGLMKFDSGAKKDATKKPQKQRKKEFVTSNHISSDYFGKLQRSLEDLENYHNEKLKIEQSQKGRIIRTERELYV